jgi:hypothetical protein
MTRFTVGEGERSPIFGEEETVAHCLIGLAHVGNEGERELPVGI